MSGPAESSHEPQPGLPAQERGIAAEPAGGGVARAPGGLGASTAVGRVLGLQRSAGNAAVVALLSRSRPGVARQPQAPPAPAAQAAEAVQYLRSMAEYLRAQREHFATLPQQQRQRAAATFNQQRVATYLQQARSTYEAQVGGLGPADPLRLQLREAYVAVLGAIRESFDAALDLAAADPATQPAEQARYAANLASWIEASPMGSTALAGTILQQGDVAAGGRYEAELSAFLDDLLARLPGLQIPPAERERISGRLDVALRRAFVTVRAGADGVVDIQTITDAAIADKYRRVVGLLQQGMPNRAQMTIITDTPPAIQLPTPVPDVTAQLTIAVDLSHVPPDEVLSVRFGVDQLSRTIFPPGSNVQLRNAYWSVSLPVRRATGVVSVRYELAFDAAGGVRVERLGAADPRAIDQGFAALSVDQKKARLVADFGLSGVDDRPAAPGRQPAVWTSAELDQVKAAYDRIPPNDRSSLQGVAIIRDHVGPLPANAQPGQVTAGFAHTAASNPHDLPGAPAHPPPHIHYYDEAFRANQFTAVGTAGDDGPGGDWTLLHEVGHMREFRAHRAANAAVVAANQQIVAAFPALNAAGQQVQWGGHAAWLQARQAWVTAMQASNQAVVAFNESVITNNAAIKAQKAQRRQAAVAAGATRDQRLQAMQTAGVPQNFVQAATNVATAIDALFTATDAIDSAGQQVPTFVALANRFGFQHITAYSGTGDDEWFAETYALFLDDPNRLNQLNRRMFQWFEADMPMDPAWNP
jgi:hypothetical protein